MKFYVLRKENAVFVKEAEFFESQGGLAQEWGRHWQPIEALSIEDARRKGEKLPVTKFSSETDARYTIDFAHQLSLEEIQNEIHQSCIAAGWHHDLDTGEPTPVDVPKLIALLHSELSEAFEGYRKDLMDDHLPHRSAIEVEFADVFIRLMDTAGKMNLDLAGAIREKFEYNQTRPDHKPEARREAGGKKI